MTSDRARQAAVALLRREQIAWYDADDLCSDCTASLITTCRNAGERGTALPGIESADEAERYARSTLRHRVYDLFRRERRRPRTVSFSAAADDDQRDRDPQSEIDVAGVVVDSAAAAGLRAEVTRALTSGSINCRGCPPAVVAAISLHLIDRYWANHDLAVPSWGPEEVPGADALSTDIYAALDAVRPGSVAIDGQRVADRSRKMKSRCQRCVTPLLQQALEAVGLMSARHPFGTTGEDR